MDWRVRKVLATMKANLHRQLAITDLARAVNLSPSRLRHLFKAEMAMTFLQYRKALKLQTARELSETTALSVKEIALRVGFRHPAHFVRDFKKSYGLPPAQYRSLHRAEVASRDRRNNETGRAEKAAPPADGIAGLGND